MGWNQTIGPQIRHAISRERHFPLVWAPVLFGAGVGTYFALTWEPKVWPVWALASAFLILFFLLKRPWSGGLLLFSAGFLVVQIHTSMTDTPRISERIGPVTLTGEVYAVLPGSGTSRIFLHGVDISGLRRIRLSHRGTAGLPRPGSRIRTRVILRPPPPPMLPGGYDSQRRAYFDGIGAFGFVIGAIDILDVPPDAPWPNIEAARLMMTERILHLYPATSGAVSAALLTGQRGYIPEQTLQQMRDAGLAHLLAISGLHIGLAAGLVFGFVRLAVAAVPRLNLRLDGKKIAAVAALLGAGAYALLAGWTIPTERAFLMAALMLTGILADRRAISLRNVALAALVILVTTPESLLTPGFQMSFAAVTALVCVYERIARRFPNRGEISTVQKIIRYVGATLLTSVIAGAATAPFAIYHFQHVATLGLIANALAVPIAAFWVMPAGLMTILGFPIGLEDWPLFVMERGVAAILWVAGTVSEMPMAATDVARQSTAGLIMLVIGALVVLLGRGRWTLLGAVVCTIAVYDPLQRANPDIIIDGRGRVVGILDAERLLPTSAQTARFEVKAWARQLGITVDGAIRPGVVASTACDSSGCVLNRNNRRIAISWDPNSIAEDCRLSDFIVALEPIWHPCVQDDKSLDRFDLWRNGTHTVSIRDHDIQVQSVNDWRGMRPWVIRPDLERRPSRRGRALSARLAP